MTSIDGSRGHERLIIFLSGSRSVGRLDAAYAGRLDNILTRDFEIVIGDAGGADLAMQHHLAQRLAHRVTVFSALDEPRHNVGNWPVRRIISSAPVGSRARHMAKDRAMAQMADYGMMLWDGRSAGTLANIVELSRRQRPSIVYAQPRTAFLTIRAEADLDRLRAWARG